MNNHIPTHPIAVAAIKAAKNQARWGKWATSRFCRNQSVPASLFTTALILEAAKRAGFH